MKATISRAIVKPAIDPTYMFGDIDVRGSPAIRGDVITLELKREEAQFLHDVCENIGGDPDNSRRHFAAKLIVALASVGTNQDTSQDVRGSIHFMSAEEQGAPEDADMHGTHPMEGQSE